MSRRISKEWIDENDRKCKMYVDGVKNFVEFAIENSNGLTTCPCCCKKCRNKRRAPFSEVEQHLIVNGMDRSYRVWVLHGENSSRNLPQYTIQEEIEIDNGEEEDFGHDRVGLGDYVDASYEVHARVAGDNLEVDNGQIGDFEEPYVPEPNLDKRYKEYKEKAEEKLYPSCEGPHTTLSAIVELHNLKKEFGWSGNGMTRLLNIVKGWLPQGNTLPDKYPVMKETVKDLGMKAKCIDACQNDCILYWKDYENALECPKCKAPRYKVKAGSSKKVGKHQSKEPHRVLRYFPLIPRLKRLYTIPWIAHDMTWHHRAKPSWDKMRHPIDSSQWRLCKTRYPEFAQEGRNVWLAISTDGFNPRGVQSTSYSCWPVIIVPYNLPPSLCLKREFQMLSLLIPGPKAPSQDIDVFLEPLLDELKELWGEGVAAYDMHKKEGFTLKAMLMWAIHDFPAFGNLSGCVTHGYKACPICGDNTPSILLETCRKIVYTNYTMFLRMDHPFRNGKFLGLRIADNRAPPKRLCGEPLLEKLRPLNYVPGKTKKQSSTKRKRRVGVNEDNDSDDDVEVTEAWYKKSILFELEYWSEHQVRHVIDVMHVEKNVAEHILNTILGKKGKTKDSHNAREDMQSMGIHSSQWIQTNQETGSSTKPVAPFLLSKEEKISFCQILKDLKLPSHFSSNLSNVVCLNPLGLLTMKSHDYHVILEYLLPVLLQHAFPKYRDLSRAMQQISLFFNLLCSKVVIRAELQEAKFMVAEALCVLEKYFPPSFFDISIHLMVHLADEGMICGPVRHRWMYPFERSMKDFKNIPSNKRYVEGSIAESYLVSESVRYAMEYMPSGRDGSHNSTRASFLDENGEYCDEGPSLDGKIVTLRPEQFVQIRRWVLFRLDVDGLDKMYSDYRESSKSNSRSKGRRAVKTEVEMQTEFIDWLYDKLLEDKATDTVLWRLVRGPLPQAKTYRKFRVNGFVFSTKSYDDTVVTQDSGVCINAITTFGASKKDKNTVDVPTMWYGVIQEILELDYIDFKEVVFYCDWVRVEDKTNGCKLCTDSNLVMVNFQKLKSKDNFYDEPVILASDASQVFYSKDLKNPNWWVVIHSPKRLTSRVDDLDLPTDFQSILQDQPNLKPLLVQRQR